jgi:hypothetical protein
VATTSAAQSHCYFFELPIELRNMIYREITRTAVLSKDTPSDRCIELHRSPVLDLLLVNKQIKLEYLDALRPIVQLDIAYGWKYVTEEGQDVERGSCFTKAFTDKLRPDFPVDFLRTVKNIAVYIEWCVGWQFSWWKRTRDWIDDHSHSELRWGQDRMAWTPTKGSAYR